MKAFCIDSYRVVGDNISQVLSLPHHPTYVNVAIFFWAVETMTRYLFVLLLYLYNRTAALDSAFEVAVVAELWYYPDRFTSVFGDNINPALGFGIIPDRFTSVVADNIDRCVLTVPLNLVSVAKFFLCHVQPHDRSRRCFWLRHRSQISVSFPIDSPRLSVTTSTLLWTSATFQMAPKRLFSYLMIQMRQVGRHGGACMFSASHSLKKQMTITNKWN